MNKPSEKPNNPKFSSGPCAKRPGWTSAALDNAWLGRSHRAAGGKAKLKEVIDRHVELLGIPEDYRCAIVPASDTGAVEMAMWNLLGERGVDMLGWESFGLDWCKDVTDQLKLDDVNVIKADYGQLSDLSKVDTDRDVVFTWNGTTSGVCVPNADWIKEDRKGLTICDATSAVFAYDLPWEKLDVVTWSWQKVLGSEGAHEKSDEDRLAFVKSMTKMLDAEEAGYDIASYRAAPAGIRIWAGATVEPSDVAKLMPWVEWAYESAKGAEAQQAA
ncbi:unnamed protein product [Cyprideis torosa]|uniref:Uncharacterized protein n=1 Tax=Cyprideis torosa TaxID=163714 RepID=A0A7R8WNC3_9CRUS|nr:unnamed protein product [Cyprideis torosa]CAG0906166.1 unnamed protein product [Cyprideis torosa]